MLFILALRVEFGWSDILYKIKLENFEGPLDLLLFFVRKDELNIYDIPIAHITRSYLEYLQMMQELNLDIASEFILMAATLMRIKVRCMLPPEPGEETEEEPLDPREELTRRLLEYRQFKEASRSLAELDEQWRLVYRRNFFDPDRLPPSDEPIGLKNVSFFDLLAAYKKAISRSSQVIYHNIERIHVTIEQQMNYIRDYFCHRQGALFTELCEGMSKIEIVVTFLALLDLIRKEEIFVRQSTVFDDIWIQKEPIPVEGLPEPAEEQVIQSEQPPDHSVISPEPDVENPLTVETDHPDITDQIIQYNQAEEISASLDTQTRSILDVQVSDLSSDVEEINPVTERRFDDSECPDQSQEFYPVSTEEEKPENLSLKSENIFITCPSVSLGESKDGATEQMATTLQVDSVESVDSALAPLNNAEARDMQPVSLYHEHQNTFNEEENRSFDAEHQGNVQALSENNIEALSVIINNNSIASERVLDHNERDLNSKIPSGTLDFSEDLPEKFIEDPIQDIPIHEQNSNQTVMIVKEESDQPEYFSIGNDSDKNYTPRVEPVIVEPSVKRPDGEDSGNLKRMEDRVVTENSVLLISDTDTSEHQQSDRQSELIGTETNSALTPSQDACTQSVENEEEHTQDTKSPIGRFFKKVISFVKKIFLKKRS